MVRGEARQTSAVSSFASCSLFFFLDSSTRNHWVILSKGITEPDCICCGIWGKRDEDGIWGMITPCFLALAPKCTVMPSADTGDPGRRATPGGDRQYYIRPTLESLYVF